MFRRKRLFLKSYITRSYWITVVVSGKTYCVTRPNIFRIPLGVSVCGVPTPTTWTIL